ncbi:hypothetical protein BaRGS_00039181, partial [Batillaria attramentaria]
MTSRLNTGVRNPVICRRARTLQIGSTERAELPKLEGGLPNMYLHSVKVVDAGPNIAK